MSAYAEAKKIFPDETEFFLLSLGTGELIRPIAYNEARDWGKVGWLALLLSCMFDGAADAANYQMKMFLGKHYIRLQTNLAVASDDMDNATNGNIENLKTEEKSCSSAISSKLKRFATGCSKKKQNPDPGQEAWGAVQNLCGSCDSRLRPTD